MALNAVFSNLRSKVRSVYNNFFYNGDEERFPAEPAAYDSPVEYSAQQPRSGGYQQPPQPQQVIYQQPMQQQPAYQQPVQQQPAQERPDAAAQPRNRRMWAHQANDNIVDIGAYQREQAPQTPAPEAPVQEAQLPAGNAARIINARGMGDCRSAITLLRNGDTVLIVLENVSDPAEMRRLVDTLSGACYSLTATITKVSRYGVYLLAPQTMAVYADQTTNQMNGAAPRPAQQRGYQQAAYPPQQQRPAYPSYMPPQQGFAPRTAAPAEAPQPFYSRPAPQPAAAPTFATQPAGYGYAPDETAAAEQ